jgi:hypothetical protein
MHLRSAAFTAPFSFTFSPERKPNNKYVSLQQAIAGRRELCTEQAETVLNNHDNDSSAALVDEICSVGGAGMARNIPVFLWFPSKSNTMHRKIGHTRHRGYK